MEAVSKEKEILIVTSDQCGLRRNYAAGDFEEYGTGNLTPKELINGAMEVRFPQLYQALSGGKLAQVITL